MAEGKEVRNGKAFEYAIAKAYYNYVKQKGVNVTFVENDARVKPEQYYNEKSHKEQLRFDNAAKETIDTMVKIEPGLLAQVNDSDMLYICLQKDQEGENGDVRDVRFMRRNPKWEIGFSAKNNNDDVKHNRLSDSIDFGTKWNLGEKCSQQYWDSVKPIFSLIRKLKQQNPLLSWEDIGREKKVEEFYKPLLAAFRNEILRIYKNNPDVPAKLISYLIGDYPFYKIIKDDVHNMVIVKAFNINGELNKTVNKKQSQYKTPKIMLPSRIIEFEIDPKHPKDTLVMVLDEGWQVSFRIHSADNPIVPSFKFAVRLIGNPPVLFTQHIFQKNI